MKLKKIIKVLKIKLMPLLKGIAFESKITRAIKSLEKMQEELKTNRPCMTCIHYMSCNKEVCIKCNMSPKRENWQSKW